MYDDDKRAAQLTTVKTALSHAAEHLGSGSLEVEIRQNSPIA